MSENQPIKIDEAYCRRMEDRLENGNAWMMCNECGAKLYDFDGDEDRGRPCPYKKNGRCNPSPHPITERL